MAKNMGNYWPQVHLVWILHQLFTILVTAEKYKKKYLKALLKLQSFV